MSVTPDVAPAALAERRPRPAPSPHPHAGIHHHESGSGVLLVVVSATAMLLVMADIVAATMAITFLATGGHADSVAPDALAGQLGVGGLAWMATAFLTPFAAGLTVGGHLADRLGHRFVLGAGLVIFSAATAAMMAAPSWLTLLAARAGQAGGAALLIPASLGLLVTHLPAPRRPVAIGWWSGAAGMGALALHASGGALIAELGWRALFLPSLVLAAALVCLLPALPADRPVAGRLPDMLGALLLAIGIGAAVLVICQGTSWGWTSRRILAAALVGLVGLAWALWRSRTHPRPAVPLLLWQQTRFRWGWLLSVMYGAIAIPILTVAPSYLAHAGFTHWWATLLLCPISAAVLLTGPLAGLASRRWGESAVAYTGAMLTVAAGTVLAWALRTNADPMLPLAALTVLGVGLGMLSAIAAAVGSDIRIPGHSALASGASMTARQAGGALGVAGASVLLDHPFLTAPAAGHLSVLASCLALAGLCGLLAVARPLRSIRTVRRAARSTPVPAPAPVPDSTPAPARTVRPTPAPSPPPPQVTSAPPVPHEVVQQLHTALVQAAQAAETWMQEAHAAQLPTPAPAPSPPSSLAAAWPTVATGAIARPCSCHPDLDPLAATILHTAPALPTPRRPVHQRLHPLESAASPRSGDRHAH
ncbi:MFS transporter [Nonomuraea sp. NPDC049400]|uniref:MFS transporter n=1 Tax=Nonomuraea sp. NPDC049400 TaxID=3364352 RepID=UPI0037B5189B